MNSYKDKGGFVSCKLIANILFNPLSLVMVSAIGQSVLFLRFVLLFCINFNALTRCARTSKCPKFQKLKSDTQRLRRTSQEFH